MSNFQIVTHSFCQFHERKPCFINFSIVDSSVYVDDRTLSRESSVISGNEPCDCFKSQWFGGFKIWPLQLGSKESIQQNLIIKHFSVPCPHFYFMPDDVCHVCSEVLYVFFRLIRKPIIPGLSLSPWCQYYGLYRLTLWMRLISGLTPNWIYNWEINHFYCLLLEITGSNSFCHSNGSNNNKSRIKHYDHIKVNSSINLYWMPAA